jgi:tetratricopeptide (TPR) repeat protein
MQGHGQINTRRLLDNGRNALYFEDYVLSIQYFNKLAELKPRMVEPYQYRAIAKIQLEDFLGAEADLNHAIELNPFEPVLYYARGFARKRLGRYVDAEADFDRALEFAPENADYLINRIETYEHTGKYDFALRDIDFLLNRKNKNANLLRLERGQILMQKGDTAAAFNNFSEAITKDSLYAEFYAARALILLLQQNDSASLADYDTAIRLKSKNIGSYINRGLLRYRVKNYRGALADYDAAVELDSTNIQALFNRAMLRSEVGDWNNAESDFSRVLALDAYNDDARYQRALVAMQLRNYATASNDMKAIIERHPAFAPAYFLRADASQALGNTRQAAIDRYRGQQLMESKGEIQHARQPDPNRRAEIAEHGADEFEDELSYFDNNNSRRYSDKIRGQVQNQHADMRLRKNFVLSYYSPGDNLRHTSGFNPLLETYNRAHNSRLVLAGEELPLVPSLIETHFETVNNLSNRLKLDSTNAALYFERGINNSLLLNLDAALEDMNLAVQYQPDFALAYFCRANIRSRLLEMQQSNADDVDKEKLVALAFATIVADYDRCTQLAPQFAPAIFNKGNIFCLKKDYNAAVAAYTDALAVQANLPEAFFNRGLCRLWLGDKENARRDLSRAGELGIYQAYNLIKRIGN